MQKSIFIILFITEIILGQYTGNEKEISTIPISTSISVTVGGSFIINGSFPASPLERVDQFITRIYNNAKYEFLKERTGADFQQIKEQLTEYADRNIMLKRINGENIILDLKKFRLNGDYKNNPYLKNDDIIIFPTLDLERNFITITGAVNNSTKFQFVQGDKISDALEFSQGVNPAYKKIEKIEITRLDYDGQKEKIITYNIGEDDELQCGDRIRVIADETSKRDFKVLVLGEVNIPGNISITKNGTTLFEVIQKAGGFKSSADLKKAELIRGSTLFSDFSKQIQSIDSKQKQEALNTLYRTLVNPEYPEDLMMQRMSYLAEEDTIYFKVDNQLRRLRGNASIDFDDLEDANSVARNYIVKDGDLIIIPEKNDLIYIFGQVPKTGYIKYEKGRDYNHYINLAGGFGQEAKDEVFIIKGRTRNWISTDEQEGIQIEPGDFIWVPKKAPKTFGFYLDRISAVTSVIGSIATIILLVVSLK